MPGESKLGGNFPGRSLEDVYQLVRDTMQEGRLTIVEERPPFSLVATQGRGRFLQRFEFSLESGTSGILLRGRVTSPEDWPAHERRARIRLGVGFVATILGVALMGLSFAYRLGDVGYASSLVLLGAGGVQSLSAWALYRSAQRLAQGREVPYWLE